MLFFSMDHTWPNCCNSLRSAVVKKFLRCRQKKSKSKSTKSPKSLSVNIVAKGQRPWHSALATSEGNPQGSVKGEHPGDEHLPHTIQNMFIFLPNLPNLQNLLKTLKPLPPMTSFCKMNQSNTNKIMAYK